MKKMITLFALVLGLFAAAPALGAEQPLLLVVSDFDAALQRETRLVEAVAPEPTAGATRELQQILVLLRQQRAASGEQQRPTTARPHEPRRQIASTPTLTWYRDPRPRR
ncbi:MAG: hypothetical protein ABIJ09_19190 [Pseudomonadota bacterium]